MLIKLSERCFWDSDIKVLTHDCNIVPLTANMVKFLEIMTASLDKNVRSVDIFFYIWDDYNKEYNPKNIRNLISNLRKRVPCLNIENAYGGQYILKKYRETHPVLNEQILEILGQAKHGIVITDPNFSDNPVIYVNDTFTEMFGYSLEDISGKNCRFLHREDKNQPGIDLMRVAITEGTSTTVTVRNYSKSGKLLYNEITINPIYDKNTNTLKYFLAILKDVTKIQELVKQIKNMI